MHVTEQTWRSVEAHSVGVRSLPRQSAGAEPPLGDVVRCFLSMQYAGYAGDTFENAGKIADELRSARGEG
jgi:hypothetical protein